MLLVVCRLGLGKNARVKIQFSGCCFAAPKAVQAAGMDSGMAKGPAGGGSEGSDAKGDASTASRMWPRRALARSQSRSGLRHRAMAE